MIDKWELLDTLAAQFKLFMHDNFLSTDKINSAVLGTGEVTDAVMSLKLSTGILSNSYAKIYYELPLFNPHYSQIIFRVRLNSMASCIAFFGFKETSADPSFDMNESHAGILVYNGKVYASTGRLVSEGPPAIYEQQRVEITGIDMTRDFLYKIIGSSFYTQPLPQIIPYFDTFRIITPDRIWTLNSANTTYPPNDHVHYIVAFIKNFVNSNKYLDISHITYGEEYAD